MSEINPQFTESKQNEYMCSGGPEWCWVYELDHIWGGGDGRTLFYTKKKKKKVRNHEMCGNSGG